MSNRNTLTEIQHLEKCIDMVEKSLPWGASDSWTNYNFEKLSEYIYEKTSVSISISTLKRMFGKIKTNSKYYKPHFTTKDALSQYLGYVDWEDFKMKNTDAQPTSRDDSKKFSAFGYKKILQSKAFRYGVLTLSAIIIVSAIIYFISKTPSKLTASDIKKIKFEGIVVEGNPPFTAQFEYDVSMFPNDSFYIFDNADGVYTYLPPDKHTKTIMYYLPEKYEVTLMHYKQQPLKKIKINAYSNDWEIFAKIPPDKITTNLGYNYFKIIPNQAFKDHELNVSIEDIHNQGHDTSKLTWIQYRMVKDFPVSLDNMTMSFRIKHHQDHIHHINSQVQIYINGSDGKIITILFSEPCCYLYSSLRCSEKVYRGHEDNLKSLGVDFSEFRDVNIRTDTKKATFTLDDEQIFYTAYNEPLGKLQSIILAFRGAGGVLGEFVLKNGKGEVVYKSDF